MSAYSYDTENIGRIRVFAADTNVKIEVLDEHDLLQTALILPRSMALNSMSAHRSSRVHAKYTTEEVDRG